MPRGPVSFTLRLLFIAALLGAWEWAVIFFQTPAYIVPAPSEHRLCHVQRHRQQPLRQPYRRNAE